MLHLRIEKGERYYLGVVLDEWGKASLQRIAAETAELRISGFSRTQPDIPVIETTAGDFPVMETARGKNNLLAIGASYGGFDQNFTLGVNPLTVTLSGFGAGAIVSVGSPLGWITTLDFTFAPTSSSYSFSDPPDGWLILTTLNGVSLSHAFGTVHLLFAVGLSLSDVFFTKQLVSASGPNNAGNVLFIGAGALLHISFEVANGIIFYAMPSVSYHFMAFNFSYYDNASISNINCLSYGVSLGLGLRYQ